MQFNFEMNFCTEFLIRLKNDKITKCIDFICYPALHTGLNHLWIEKKLFQMYLCEKAVMRVTIFRQKVFCRAKKSSTIGINTFSYLLEVLGLRYNQWKWAHCYTKDNVGMGIPVMRVTLTTLISVPLSISDFYYNCTIWSKLFLRDFIGLISNLKSKFEHFQHKYFFTCITFFKILKDSNIKIWILIINFLR